MNRLYAWLQNVWYRQPLPPWYLRLLAHVYGQLAGMNKRRAGTLKTQPLPLIMVGNLTVGGSGKTPLVIHLAGLLQQAGIRVAVLARIYKGSAQGPLEVDEDSLYKQIGDEPLLLKQHLDCPVVVSRKRFQAYDYIINKYPDIDLIISDDGFQHHRLKADLRVLVVAADRGFGNGYLLPAGPLREPLQDLDGFDYIVVKQSRANAHGQTGILRLLRESAADPVIMNIKIEHAVNLCSGEQRPLHAFAGQVVDVVAAIADPENFFQLLRQQGIMVRAHALPDHNSIPARLWQQLPADRVLLMTAKDAVKCAASRHPNCWYVPLRTVLPESFAQAWVAHCRKLL